MGLIMENKNITKSLLFKVLLAIVFVCCTVLYLHYNAEYRQAKRELEYLKALNRVTAEKQQRVLEYEKRMQEQQLRREYNQGRIAGQAPSSVIN